MSRGRNGKPSTTDRLMSRATGSLASKAMPDGGEVFTGGLASKALDAIGARAMTMDGSIFVNEGFGSTPEDQALYAHERVHEQGSGGHDEGDHNHGNDPEEMAARAVERMVLHKTRMGEDFGDVLAGMQDGIPKTQEEAEEQIHQALPEERNNGTKDKALLGYWALRAQGLSDKDVRRQLTDFVTRTMEKIDEENSYRSTSESKF